MKLGRLRTLVGVRPALWHDDQTWRDLSGHVADIGAAQISPAALDALRAIDPAGLPVISGTPAPFLDDIRRIFCIGLNYHDHAIEVGLPVPEHPILFMKACEATGAQDPILLPRGATKTDWEVELGFVIGTQAAHVSADDALAHVAGYFVANDVSERSYQFDFGGQWVKGKSADSFAPIGPYLVTTDEIADLRDLTLTLDVNGVRRQTGNTSTMIFGVPQIISHISQFITLRAGDLVLTGTPPGVGTALRPPVFLQKGDVVTAAISGLGALHQQVI